MGLLLTLFFQSCQKNINDIEQKNNVHINSFQFQGVSLNQDGYLMFATSQIFDQYVDVLDEMTNQEIDSIEQQLGYISSYTLYYDEEYDSVKLYGQNNEVNSNQSVEDETLLRIIDKNGVLQIENTIYRIVADSNFVYSMNVSQKQGNNFSDMLTGHFNSSVMNRLSEDIVPEHMTVFEYVDSVPAGTAPTTFGLFKKVDTHMTTDPPYPGSSIDFRIRCKAVQQNIVVKKRLIVKTFYERKASTSSLWVRHKTDFRYDNTFDNKANIKINGNSFYNTIYPSSEFYDWHIDVKKLKWKVFEGGKKLRDWYGQIRFSYKNQLGELITYTFIFEKP